MYVMASTPAPPPAAPPSDRAWSALVTQAPELAARVRSIFDAGRHKTMATLRRDGSPRISGIEIEFVDGELTLGMMPGSVKLADVRRDPRVALHSPTIDPPQDATAWAGDAKISGVLAEIGERTEDPPGSQFRLEIAEVVCTFVAPSGDALVVESWRPGEEVRRVERT